MLNKRSSLLAMLIWLTLLSVVAQIILFVIHSHVTELVDDLVKSSIGMGMLHPVILLPIIQFIFIQLLSYILFIAWIWFISVEIGSLLRLSKRAVYFLGLFFWAVGAATILVLNNYYYPHSFFSNFYTGKINGSVDGAFLVLPRKPNSVINKGLPDS